MISLTKEQEIVLMNAGYIEHATKQGLWVRGERGVTRYVDFRSEPRSYRVEHGVIMNDDNIMLNAVLALKAGQKRLIEKGVV